MTIKSTLDGLKHQARELQKDVAECSRQDVSSLSPAQKQKLENMHTLILSPEYQMFTPPSKRDREVTILSSANRSLVIEKEKFDSIRHPSTNEEKIILCSTLKVMLQGLQLLSHELLTVEEQEIPEPLIRLISSLKATLEDDAFYDAFLEPTINPEEPSSPLTTNSDAILEDNVFIELGEPSFSLPIDLDDDEFLGDDVSSEGSSSPSTTSSDAFLGDDVNLEELSSPSTPRS